jgi:hypothetical protein
MKVLSEQFHLLMVRRFKVSLRASSQALGFPEGERLTLHPEGASKNKRKL